MLFTKGVTSLKIEQIKIRANVNKMILGNYNYYICWNLPCSVFAKGFMQIKALTTFIHPTHVENIFKAKKLIMVRKMKGPLV